VDQGRVDLGRVDRAGPAVRDLGRGRVDLAVRDLVDLVDPAGLADIRDLVGLAARDRADQVGPVDLDRVVRDLVDREALVHLADIRDRVDLADQGMDRVDLAHIRDRVDLADQGMDRVDLAGREDLGDQGMNRAGLVVRLDLAGPVDRVDRHRRRTRPGVLSTGVAPRWVAPGMRRTASARPATVRRLRPHNTDGAGMTGLRPEGRRLSGTDRRPRVAGTVHRLPAAGTAHGTVRRVT
jgi:hypothetical protein